MFFFKKRTGIWERGPLLPIAETDNSFPKVTLAIVRSLGITDQDATTGQLLSNTLKKIMLIFVQMVRKTLFKTIAIGARDQAQEFSLCYSRNKSDEEP